MHSRPCEMNTHEERHRHTEENAEQSKPQIVEPDGLVVGVEGVEGQEAGLRRLLVIGSAAVVVGHACSGETRELPETQLWPRE